MQKSLQKTNETVPPKIFVEHLSVRLNHTDILSDVSFEVPRGHIAAVIGPNGSGKTTLLKALLSLVPIQTGTVLFDGKSIAQVRKEIGYVPQRFSIDPAFPITVKELLDMTRFRDRSRTVVDEKMREVGLDSSLSQKRLGLLSGGEWQRVLIAQALLNDPTLLILDEPATGIDMVGEGQFYALMKHVNEQHGTTILLVSHDIGMISNVVDTVICINRKLLCSGPPRIALSEQKLSELYGRDDASLYTHRHNQK